MIALTILPAGHRERAELDAVRESIAPLLDERDEHDEAPFPASDAFELAFAAIKQRANGSDTGLLFYSVPGATPPADAPDDFLDPWVRMYLLAPERFEKELRAYFERGVSSPGLPIAKRTARRAELKREIESLREREETAWLELLSRNLLTERRHLESGDVDRVLRIWNQVAAQ